MLVRFLSLVVFEVILLEQKSARFQQGADMEDKVVLACQSPECFGRHACLQRGVVSGSVVGSYGVAIFSA